MPHFQSSSYGDLFVEYNVVLPIELSFDTRRRELPLSIHTSSVVIVHCIQIWRKRSMARMVVEKGMSYRLFGDVYFWA